MENLSIEDIQDGSCMYRQTDRHLKGRQTDVHTCMHTHARIARNFQVPKFSLVSFNGILHNILIELHKGYRVFEVQIIFTVGEIQ